MKTLAKLLLLALAALLATTPAEAARKQRHPARLPKTPTKALTFACREESDGPVRALGTALLRADLSDAHSGTFEMNLFVGRPGQAGFQGHIHRGKFSEVPGGYVLTDAGFTLHAHPQERTNLPGTPNQPTQCEPTAELGGKAEQ